MPFLRLIPALACTLVALCSGASALAQGTYPDRPVKVIVALPAGGSADMIARVVTQKMATELGQPFVVDNKAGASGQIGTPLVSRAAPDGYTLMVSPASFLTTNKSIFKTLPYDPEADFVPITKFVNQPMVLVVKDKQKFPTVAAVIAAAKAAPGKLTFGSAGNGNTGHLAAEYFSSIAGVKMTHVPYKGSAGVVNAMLAGDIDLTFDSISTSMPHIRGGRMHALAVTSPQRSALAPEVPTVQEQGMAGFDVTGWYALIAPAGTPPEITQRLSREIAAALRQPQLQSQLAAGGYEPVGSTPEALQAHIEREITRWAAVVKSTGARVD